MQILKVFHHQNCEYYWFKNKDFSNMGNLIYLDPFKSQAEKQKFV